jgi:Rod binding domain-containing protein
VTQASIPTVDALAQAQSAKPVPGGTDKSDKAARQFEGLLMSLVFQTMRKTIQPSGLFGDSGSSRSTYEYLMDQAVVDRAVAAGHGWGLADRLKASWSRLGQQAAKKEVPAG